MRFYCYQDHFNSGLVQQCFTVITVNVFLKHFIKYLKTHQQYICYNYLHQVRYVFGWLCMCVQTVWHSQSVSRSVCLSVCWSRLSPEKKSVPFEIAFGVAGLAGPGNHVFYGRPHHPKRRGNFGGHVPIEMHWKRETTGFGCCWAHMRAGDGEAACCQITVTL